MLRPIVSKENLSLQDKGTLPIADLDMLTYPRGRFVSVSSGAIASCICVTVAQKGEYLNLATSRTRTESVAL